MASHGKPFLQRVPVFPFLLALAPALNLYSVNIWGSSAVEFIRPMLVHLAFAGVIFAVCLSILRSYRKAAILSFVPILGATAFGYASSMVYTTIGPNIPDTYLLLAWSALTLGVFYLLLRKLKGTSSQLFKLTAILNTFSTVLILLPVLNLAMSGLVTAIEAGKSEAQAQSAEPVDHEWLPPDYANAIFDNRPDVYFIILDSYARGDVLESRFGFDNSKFIEWLRLRGFYIAKSSHSNYAWTHLSIGATLNGEYLQSLVPSKLNLNTEFTKNRLDRFQLFQSFLWSKLIRDSRVVRFFSDLGYQIVSNVAVSKTQGENQKSFTEALFGPLNESEKMLLNNSILRLTLSSLETDIPKSDFSDSKAAAYKYGKIMEALSTLQSDVKINSPKFVFYHVMSPHDPFCFDANGNPVPRHPYYDSTQWDKFSMEGYRDYYKEHYPVNVAGLNRHMIPVIEKIQDESHGDAVIIIQADHGSALGLDPESSKATDMQERFATLSAIYIPEKYPRKGLADDLSLVNTFPVVLNNVFGLSIPTLENHAYYSDGDLDFADVTDRVKTKPVPTPQKDSE